MLSKGNVKTVVLTAVGVMLAGAAMHYLRGTPADNARAGFNG